MSKTAFEAELEPGATAFIEAAETTPEPVVVRTSVELDVDTAPLSAYAALSQADDSTGSTYSFLLESAGKVDSSDPDGAFRPANATPDRHARFSFVGYDPEAVIEITAGEASVNHLGGGRFESLIDPDGGDTLDTLRSAMPDVELAGFDAPERQRLDGGFVGFLAYDAVYDLWLDEVGRDRPDSPVPDAEFVLTTRTLVFDELNETLELIQTPVVRPDDDPAAVYEEVVTEAERVQSVLAGADAPEPGGFEQTDEQAGARETYEESVRRAKEHVLDGDIYQGVVSRKRELFGTVDPLALYEALRDINPSPYMYLLDHGSRTVVGASPETLVSVRGDEVMVNPIAGTCPRGASPVEDRKLAGEMLADGKERAEHTMLVDLARNDVRRVADAGSVRVNEFMNVLKYSHVQHIESTVTGRLRDDRDAFDATRATFPAGTLSGAPKIRAMEIIDDLEAEPRGLYGGGVGYYSWTGDADTAIVIRTATIDKTGDATDANGPISGPHNGPQRITIQAGAGLVADSDPTAEFEETESKMDGVLAALGRIKTTAPEVDQ